VEEIKKVDQRAGSAHAIEQRRRGLQASKRQHGLLRCPACFMVQDFAVEGFACILSRCPRVFVNVDPPSVPQSAAAGDNVSVRDCETSA